MLPVAKREERRTHSCPRLNASRFTVAADVSGTSPLLQHPPSVGVVPNAAPQSLTLDSATEHADGERSRVSSIRLANALPLLTTSIVVAVLLVAIALTWATLTQTALSNAQERIDRAEQQLITLVGSSIRAMNVRGRAVASDTLVRQVLRNGIPRDSAILSRLDEVLARIGAPNDTTGRIELWTASGARLRTTALHGVRPLLARTPAIPEGTATMAAHFAMPAIVPVDSVQLGPLTNCAGNACYWTVMPVVENAAALGYVALLRKIVQNPTGQRTVRGLTGGTLNVYLRNADNSLWTSIFGEVTAPPRSSPDDSHRTRPGVGEVMFADAPIAGASFRLVTEVPREEVLAPARLTVRWLATVGAILTLLGAVIAWLLGRRLVNPLVTVSAAARRVAEGNFDIRVPAAGTEEMATLATSFNHMAEQVGASLKAVETASRAKSDFLATMSHELRTPLNAIGGYVDLIELGLRGPVTDLQRHDLARIRQSQAHLLALISAVLDLNRVERGQVSYDLATLPVEPFLAGLDALVAPQAAAKTLTLAHERSDGPLCVVADREKLRQVMLNLLSNAIRYTPPGGRISLGATLAPHDRVLIRVVDTGPGIPIERQDEIFEPFVQLDRSLTTSREGVGLGLAISRDLARGMGGELRVESAAGMGACFVVELPRGNISDALAVMTTAEMPAPVQYEHLS